MQHAARPHVVEHFLKLLMSPINQSLAEDSYCREPHTIKFFVFSRSVALLGATPGRQPGGHGRDEAGDVLTVTLTWLTRAMLTFWH